MRRLKRLWRRLRRQPEVKVEMVWLPAFKHDAGTDAGWSDYRSGR